MNKLTKIYKKNKITPDNSRITSDNVDVHREKVLTSGRRFKYPIQYTKHKVAINAIIISLIVLVIVIIVGWWQLYPQQNTSDFMYRVTKILSLPVAEVDDEKVLYSDYLMRYRASIHYQGQVEQVDFSAKDGESRQNYLKRQSMDAAIANTYASKLAKEINISVNDSEVESSLSEKRKTSYGEVSEQTYNSIVLDYYGWTPQEYRYEKKKDLLQQKVAYQIDTNAENVINQVAETVNNNASISFQTLAEQFNSSAVYGTSGWVSKTNQDYGLSEAAAKLEKNGVSSIVKSTTDSGYYIVRLLDINDTKVSYEYIQVPLTEFKNRLQAIKDDGKVTEYIKIES